MSSTLAHDRSSISITFFLPQHRYSRPGAPRSCPESWLLRQGGGQRRVRGCSLKALLRQLLGSSRCSAFPRRLWKGQGVGASKELRTAEILSPRRQGRAFLLQRDAGHVHHIGTSPVRPLILTVPWGVSCCWPRFTDDDSEALRSNLPSATWRTQGRGRIQNQGL